MLGAGVCKGLEAEGTAVWSLAGGPLSRQQERPCQLPCGLGLGLGSWELRTEGGPCARWWGQDPGCASCFSPPYPGHCPSLSIAGALPTHTGLGLDSPSCPLFSPLAVGVGAPASHLCFHGCSCLGPPAPASPHLVLDVPSCRPACSPWAWAPKTQARCSMAPVGAGNTLWASSPASAGRAGFCRKGLKMEAC